MIGVGGTDEFVVGRIHQIPDSLDLGGYVVYEFFWRDTCLFCFQLDLLAMLIGSGLEEYIVALLTFEAGDAVREYDLVGISNVRFAGCVGNRRGDIIFRSDFLPLLSFLLSNKKTCLIPLFCSRKKTGLFTRDTTSFRPCLTAETSAGTFAIPLRCNRRNLSQPYRFRLLFSRFGAPLGSHVRSAAPPPLSACKTGMVFGGVLCKFANADVLSSSLCFHFMHCFCALVLC